MAGEREEAWGQGGLMTSEGAAVITKEAVVMAKGVAMALVEVEEGILLAASVMARVVVAIRVVVKTSSL